MNKKDVVVAIFAAFCLTALLFMTFPTKSNPASGEYDPWVDLNDDGSIDIFDAITLAAAFGTSGTPLNKTQILSDLQTKMNSKMFQSSLLLHLPAPATEHGFTPQPETILLSLDLNQTEAGDQQCVFVKSGITITVTGEFQNFDWPGIITQVFFIYSWTPSWPPPNSNYYHALYEGSPGLYPGVKQTFSFHLTVPNTPDAYYLYFCREGQFSMEDAVNMHKTPQFSPCAIIYVYNQA
jgi:hypothetical protein